MKNLWVLLIMGFIAVGCGSSESDTDKSEDGVEATSDGDTVDNSGGGDEIKKDELSEIGELEGVDPSTPEAAENKPAENSFASTEGESTPPAADQSLTSAPETSAPVSGGTYTVQRGDTLMQVAFKATGDVYKWKEIYQMNSDKISNPNKISVGMVLNIPQSGFVDNRAGNPYVIKQGDTLASISKAMYGTLHRWKEIYQNNSGLIKNPNRIYAGFTLFLSDGSNSGLTNSESTQGPGPASVEPSGPVLKETAPKKEKTPKAPEAPAANNGGDELPPMDGVVTPDAQGDEMLE